MIKSGYVLAGFETLIGILNNFCNNTKGRYIDNFTRNELSNFFDNTMSGFLHSYGDHFPGKKKYDKYSETEANVYKKCRNTKICDNMPFITDSGGFQISIGRMDRTEAELLLKMYYDEFLTKYHDAIDRAFILDIPPGQNCDIFNDFNDLYDWNLRSYSKAALLPDEIREKIIYVHHFRSPNLWNVFQKLLRENNFFERFDHFATGGIVANMSGDTNIPCIIYVLPLIPLLNECIKYKKTKLDFHILGGANFRDLLFYETFKLHIFKVHGIEVNFTYDSSGLYKGLMIGRFINFLDNDGVVQKLDLRSAELDMRFKNSRDTVRSVFGKCINEFAINNNFAQVDGAKIYDEKTFYEEIKVYSMLFMLSNYSTVQTYMRDEIARIYPLYESGDLDRFSTECENITMKLNGNKISRKQKSKTYSIINSMRMLDSLDEDYCKHIVVKFLAKDEFTNLIANEKILTV